MTNDEKSDRITRIVAEFAVAYWHRLRWQAGQFFPGADAQLELAVTADNVLQRMMEPQEWLVMARYGANLVDEDAQYVYEICQGVVEWLFAIPGSNAYAIPDTFADTPFGALWAAALVRAQGDELITMTAAAELAGVTVQAINGRIARGTLRAYIDPFAANPQRERRLVKRGDVTKKGA